MFQTHLIPTRDWNWYFLPAARQRDLFQTHLIPTRDWNVGVGDMYLYGKKFQTHLIPTRDWNEPTVEDVKKVASSKLI